MHYFVDDLQIEFEEKNVTLAMDVKMHIAYFYCPVGRFLFRNGISAKI